LRRTVLAATGLDGGEVALADRSMGNRPCICLHGGQLRRRGGSCNCATDVAEDADLNRMSDSLIGLAALLGVALALGGRRYESQAPVSGGLKTIPRS